MIKADGLRVPSRDELVAVFKALPFIDADQPELEAAADYVRRIYRQPGRDDLSLVLRVPANAWIPEPEAHYAGELVALAKQIEKVRVILEHLPSNAWQVLDGAELAALNTFTDFGVGRNGDDDDEPGDLRVRSLLENLADDAERIAQTLIFAAEFGRAGGTKYLTQEFSDAAAYTFSVLARKSPTRRHDAYDGSEYGPFFEFVEALRSAFNHPASATTLAKSAVGRWRQLRHVMDGSEQKSG